MNCKSCKFAEGETSKKPFYRSYGPVGIDAKGHYVKGKAPYYKCWRFPKHEDVSPNHKCGEHENRTK